MAITNGYITLSLLKSSLQIPADDTQDDEFLELAIESASRQIDAGTERQFFATTESRNYTPRDSITVEINDLTSLTTLKTSTDANGTYDQPWAEKDYQLEPLNGLAGGIPTPATLIRAIDEYLFPTDLQEATVEVTGTFGYTPVPIQIEQATLILASRLFERRNSPLGIAGFSDIGAVRVSRFDSDIENLINPFRRIRMA